MISLDTKCRKCGTTLRRQMFFAMMIDCGAKTLDPCKCPNGGDHEFIEEEVQSSTSEEVKK